MADRSDDSSVGLEVSAPPVANGSIGVRLRLDEGNEQREVSVLPERRYELSVSCTHRAERTARGAIVTVAFLDASGKKLEGPYRHCHTSESVGEFQYLTVEDERGIPGQSRLALESPVGSAKIRLGFRTWNAKDAELDPEWVLVPVERARQLTEKPYDKRWKVAASARYLLSVRAVHDGGLEPRGALLSVDFRDRHGDSLVPPREFFRSPKFGYTRYVLVGAAADPVMVQRMLIEPPEGSASLTIRLSSWDAGPSARLRSEVELRPFDGCLALDEELQLLEYRVNALWQYHLLGNLSSAAGVGRRSVLATFAFHDPKSSLISPPYGFEQGRSEDYGAFRYLEGDGVQTSSSFQLAVRPPKNSSRLFLGLRAWGAVSQTLLESDLVLRPVALRVDGADRGEVLRVAMKIASKEPLKARSAVSSLLKKSPRDPATLRAQLAIDKALGRIRSCLDTSFRLCSAAPGQDTEREFRQWQGRWRELDPTWRPKIPFRAGDLDQEPSGQIAHLLKTAYPFESTGGSIRTQNTLAAQQRLGLKPFGITPVGYPGGAGPGEVEARALVDGVPYQRLRVGSGAELDRIPLDKRLELDTLLTAKVFRTEKPILIHAASGYRGYELALKGLSLRACFGIPLVYEVRSLHEHTWGPGGLYAKLADYTAARVTQENRCMRGADAVVTISKTMRAELVGRGVPEGKIDVVPNAVDAERFKPRPADRDLLEELGLIGKHVVGYISNLSWREGHDTLLEGFAIALRESVQDLACLIVGEGPERQRLEKLAVDLGIREQVLFTGAVDHAEIARYYSLIDTFVVPRRRDFASDLVTPLKPYEAMAMERTLVVSDRPALREVVEEGKYGMLFRSESSEALAATIQLLLESPELGAELGSSARQWVKSHRSWDANAARYKELYDELLAPLTRG